MGQVFFADGGAVYDVETRGVEVIVTGRSSRVTYGRHDVTTSTRLERTGTTVRRQPTGRPFPVRGVRGVLHLDTGEGVERIPGVIAVSG